MYVIAAVSIWFAKWQPCSGSGWYHITTWTVSSGFTFRCQDKNRDFFRMCDAKKSGPFRALTIMLTAKQDTVMPRNTKKINFQHLAAVWLTYCDCCMNCNNKCITANMLQRINFSALQWLKIGTNSQYHDFCRPYFFIFRTLQDPWEPRSFMAHKCSNTSAIRQCPEARTMQTHSFRIMTTE